MASKKTVQKVITEFCVVRMLILLGLLVIIDFPQAMAGAVPMPLEVNLDMAQYVVIGRITQIEEPNVPKANGISWGQATVEINEVLKGTQAKTINFRVATGRSKNYGGSSSPRRGSSPLRIRRVGDSGIWLIGATGTVSHSFGLLPEAHKSDIKQILKTLAERKWSKPVNGLRAWAGVVYPDYSRNLDNPSRNTVIIFAVKNVSDVNIFVPSELETGFITANIVSQDGKTEDYFLSNVVRRNSETVFCRKLSPGKTVYLHPEYTCINLAKKQGQLPEKSEGLLPGKYSVVICCKNEKEGEIADGPARRVQVSAWKGVLKAPPVELVLNSPSVRGALD